MFFKRNTRPRPTKHASADDLLSAFKDLADSAKDNQERAFYEFVLKEIDFSEYTRMNAAHLARDEDKGAVKYFDLPSYLETRYKYAVDLGLHLEPGQTILDIGCGPGHFAFVCNYLGHRVIGLDIPTSETFNDLIQFFGVKRIISPVQRLIPLVETPKCDLVTAYHATFFKKKNRKLFTIPEWCFFFEDLIKNHIKPKGRIFMILDSLEKWNGPHATDAEFVSFIQANGGKMNGHRVLFDDVSLCPEHWLLPRLERPDDIADALVVLAETGYANEAAQLAIDNYDTLRGHHRAERASILAFIRAGQVDRAIALAKETNAPKIVKLLVRS